MPIRRVHESVDLAEEFRQLERRGEKLISVLRDGVYLDIVTADAPRDETRGAA